MLWSLIIDCLGLAEDGLGHRLLVGDSVYPAIAQYDACGLPLQDWTKLYGIDPDGRLTIQSFFGSWFTGWVAKVRDQEGYSCAIPTAFLWRVLEAEEPCDPALMEGICRLLPSGADEFDLGIF